MGVNHRGESVMLNKLKTLFSKTTKEVQPFSTDFTIDEFRQEFFAVLEPLKPDSQYSYNQDTQTINEKNNEVDGLKIYLGNLFNKTKNMSVEERRKYIEHFLNESMNTETVSLNLVQERMFYRLRTEAELSNREIYLRSAENDSQKFVSGSVGELKLELVIDQETTIRTPTSKMLTELGITDKDLFEIAYKNMIKISQNNGWTLIENNIWQSNYQDDYDGARLVSLYPETKLPFSGSPIAFMPSHSVCLITTEENTDALKTMIDIGNELAVDHRPLTHKLWTFKNGGWVPLTLTMENPAYALAARQNLIDSSRWYAEQKEILENNFERDQLDIFVASFQAIENEEKDLFSYSVLSFGVNTLLPRTDKVFFVDDNQPKDTNVLGSLDWTDFLNVLGRDRFKIYENLSPIRYDFILSLIHISEPTRPY